MVGGERRGARPGEELVITVLAQPPQIHSHPIAHSASRSSQPSSSCPSDMNWVSLRCGTTVKRKGGKMLGTAQIKCRRPTSLGVCISHFSDQSCSAASGCLGFASQRLTWLQPRTCHLPTCKSWSRLHPVGLDARRALAGRRPPKGTSRGAGMQRVFLRLCV
jgi:hypothetical protein